MVRPRKGPQRLQVRSIDAHQDRPPGPSPLLAATPTRRAALDLALQPKAQSHRSPREPEILQLLIRGKRYKEVADFLGISAHTVKHYVEHLKQRFHESQLLPLADYLVGHGLIQRHA